MGNVHIHRGRLAPAFILVALLVLAVVAGLGMTAGPASAIAAYQHGGAVCANCHGTGTVTSAACETCHTGYKVPSADYSCWTCHTPGQDMQAVKTGAPASCTATCHLANGTDHAHNPHPERGTCTTCHNVTTNATTPNGSPHHVAPVATTTLSAKVAPTSVTHGKTVKVTGKAGPAASLKGAKVAFKVERKVGTKWVKMKAGTATASATGAFTWSYKTAKAGAHRVTVSIAKTATYTAKSLVKTFKVK